MKKCDGHRDKKSRITFMKDRTWYDKVSFWIAIFAGISTMLSLFFQIRSLGNEPIDSQVNIIVNENSGTIENVTVSENTAIRKTGVINENNIMGDYNIIGDYNTVVNQYDLESDKEHNMEINEMIQELSLGMSEEYVKEMLGIPVYRLEEQQLINEFYILEKTIIIRCIFEERGVLVGYIVTAKQADKSIEFPDPMHNGGVLKYGSSTINVSESDTYKGEMIANLGNGDAYNYYWQCYHLVHVEEVSGFIVAILPYGFYEENANELMKFAGADKVMLSAYSNIEVDLEDKILEYKEQLHPNTYGVIDIDYKESIYPYIDHMYWESCVKRLMED